MSSNNCNKRRRISGCGHSQHFLVADEEAEDAPPEVPSSCPAPVLSASEPPSETIGAAEPALEGISKLLLVDMQKDDPTEVSNALYKLQDLVTTAHEQGDANRLESYDLGAHMICLMAMRKYPRHEKVQLYGCSFITLLAKREQKGYRAAFVKAGGFHSIVQALQTFPDEKCLQSSGLRAIYNLIHDDADALSRFVQTMNGIALILKPMKKYPDHTCMLTACCAVFGLLAKDDDYKGLMKRAGVVSAVAAASEKHLANAGIQTHAGIFMKRIYS